MLFSRVVKEAESKDPGFWTKKYHNVFKSGDGKLVLLDLMRRASFFEVSANSDEERLLAGKRALMLSIFSELSVDPADLVLAEDAADDMLDSILGENFVKKKGTK